MTQQDWLARQGFFGSLSAAEKALIAGKATLCHYQDGEVIFRRDEVGDALLAVQTGRVRIVLYAEDGREILLNLVGAGEIFGELAFLDGEKRSADALADGPCALMVLSRSELRPLLAHHPEIALKFFTYLAALLRQNTERIETLAFLPLPARLARILLRLAERYGRTLPGGVLIGDDLNQSDYGQLAASSRESVNKQLRLWQQAGVIDDRKDGILLRDFPALLRLAARDENEQNNNLAVSQVTAFPAASG